MPERGRVPWTLDLRHLQQVGVLGLGSAVVPAARAYAARSRAHAVVQGGDGPRQDLGHGHLGRAEPGRDAVQELLEHPMAVSGVGEGVTQVRVCEANTYYSTVPLQTCS